MATLTDAAARNREAAARRSRSAFSAVADIGDIPPVVDAERRNDCGDSLELFLQTYFPNSTGLAPFSEDHKAVIATIEQCIRNGGRFINAVYRGFAKTTISVNSAIWAVLYGYRRYVVVFSANEPQADDVISAIKMELSDNDLLYEDFPEVCHAVRALEGKPQRCTSQTHQGALTHIAWRADRVRLPFIPDSVASGALVASRGLTGSGTRGLVHGQPDGTRQRPDFVIIDDPQTNESAESDLQTAKRLDTIKRSILKLAGHRTSMACVINATVIAQNDLVEQLCDPARNPSWQSARIKMVRKWADAHESFWLGPYAEKRQTFDREDPKDVARAHAAATELYRQNRATADAGCVVSWEHCYGEGELSAIQHAYNMLIDDGADVFASECQNEPKKSEADGSRLTVKDIMQRTNGFDRYVIPQECEHVTAFIDVQENLLYYVVAAWAPDFTGFVIDYGTFPQQSRRFFRASEAQVTLQTFFPGEKLESQWYKGLTLLVDDLRQKPRQRVDGAALSLGRVLIDANYGLSTKAVKRFCEVHPARDVLLPTHGRGITAAGLPMAEWPTRPGERRGFNWLIRPDMDAKGIRHGIYDTNYWKSFLQARLRQFAPAPGSVSLWGKDGSVHEQFATHLAAEFPIRTEGRGRTVDQWKQLPNEPDNHWLDGIVGCCVGASILGATLGEHRTIDNGRKKVAIPAHMRRA